MAQKKKTAEVPPVEEAVKAAPKAKAKAAPKKSKDRKFLEGLPAKITGQPLTKRDIVNLINDYLNKG
jgi:hypothetical protein